ncbi:MAG: ABC transporter permease subunit [Anaerolineales bacterium]|nr:ABC transporter permease subunit [Anaerolineales bacterium]
MNIVLRELRANFKSLIIWSVIVLLFVTVGFSKFSAYEGNPELLAILDSMPPAVIEAFNFNAFNLTTITGFFGVMFGYFSLILSISAAMWGSDIITKEERDKTVEFALTLPVTRSKLVTGKIIAAVINSIALLLVTLAAILVNATAYQTDSQFYDFVSLSMVALFILQMIFLAVGILLGCAMTHYKRASSLAVSILLGAYFLSIIAGLNENLDFLKYFSPFKYFNPGVLLHESRLDMNFILLSAGIIVVSLVAAYMTYAKRDLYI